ncbi:MAG: hypothetical protein R3342_04380 [Lutibacter sp.]|uniref:hypothetical protein n=1 Tax=Lutibacter sp. TaxID=1925666 RepID=UPI00299F2DFA|nr:hypothetical protein [Lutibacter sp.]MDX1828765.1 hypothetical protein [Lutibacter sp.]
MKQIIFEVTKYKKTKIYFPIDITRKYPVHSHYLLQQAKNKVVYKYDPASNLNEEEYKKYL